MIFDKIMIFEIIVKKINLNFGNDLSINMIFEIFDIIKIFEIFDIIMIFETIAKYEIIVLAMTSLTI